MLATVLIKEESLIPSKFVKNILSKFSNQNNNIIKPFLSNNFKLIPFAIQKPSHSMYVNLIPSKSIQKASMKLPNQSHITHPSKMSKNKNRNKKKKEQRVNFHISTHLISISFDFMSPIEFPIKLICSSLTPDKLTLIQRNSGIDDSNVCKNCGSQRCFLFLSSTDMPSILMWLIVDDFNAFAIALNVFVASSK